MLPGELRATTKEDRTVSVTNCVVEKAKSWPVITTGASIRRNATAVPYATSTAPVRARPQCRRFEACHSSYSSVRGGHRWRTAIGGSHAAENR